MSLDYDTRQGLIRHFSQERLDRRTADEIQGIAASVALDGAISDDEIRMLAGWLDAHAADADRWPLRDLVSMFRRFLSDGCIDEPERRELLDYLSAIAASAERSGTAADVVFESAPDLEFEHRAFAFTGVLRSMSRKQAQVEVEARGGTYHDGPRLDTDYLVVIPIRADYVGKNMPTSFSDRVEVSLDETGKKDKVVLISGHNIYNQKTCWVSRS